MSGLLSPALVCPLTGPAVGPVIYVYDHAVGPGCHGQQDGNRLINTLSSPFTLQPETKIIKQYDCLFRSSVSFPRTITFYWPWRMIIKLLRSFSIKTRSPCWLSANSIWDDLILQLCGACWVHTHDHATCMICFMAAYSPLW